MTTYRIPLTKEALLKLALTLQELAQDTKEGYASINEVQTDLGVVNFIFLKGWENKKTNGI